MTGQRTLITVPSMKSSRMEIWSRTINNNKDQEIPVGGDTGQSEDVDLWSPESLQRTVKTCKE